MYKPVGNVNIKLNSECSNGVMVVSKSIITPV